MCNCMFWDERGAGLTRQPVGPALANTTTITTVVSINRIESGSLSSRCYTLRRTHTSAGPIRLLCTRLALPLTLSRPSGFAPSVRLIVCVSPRALWLVRDFLCYCLFWDERKEDLLGNWKAHNISPKYS